MTVEGDDFPRLILYRIVYGAARDRLERFYTAELPESVRRDPLRGTRIDPAEMNDPETRATVMEAVEDAIARRRPRW